LFSFCFDLFDEQLYTVSHRSCERMNESKRYM
jgi:hypothetical protein